MPSVPFLDLKAQYAALQGEIDSALRHVFEEGSFVLGSDVAAFEAAFAAFCGSRFALGVSNGLDALRMGLAALGIGAGDEVILPANTYIASALAVSAVGARPVLADCDPETFEIDLSSAASVCSARAKAIMPVHLLGLMANMDRVAALAEKHGLFVIEDAAQSQGASFKGRKSGSFGNVGCTSFYPTKNLGAYGDAGAVTTDDPELARKIGMLRNYGQAEKYHHMMKGANCRLDSLQAAVLRVKLGHLEAWNAARRALAKAYLARLEGVGDLHFQRVPEVCVPVYHVFAVRTEKRDALKAFLEARGIGTNIHYPVPIHLQEAYAELGYKRGAFPEAERLANEILSLPLYPEMGLNQLEVVCAAVKAFFG